MSRFKEDIMQWKPYLIFALILPVVFGCGSPDPVAGGEQGGTQVFEVTGRITSIPADRETMVIAHEEISGFMPAMTMPFYLLDASTAEGLEPGDAIRFRYVVEERRSWIEEIERIDADGLAQDRDEGFRLQRQRLPIPRLEPGDRVPGFELIDQTGANFSLHDFHGEAIVLTFIFTRCPVPDFCPRMSRHFQEIQAEAAADDELRDRFRLLSVTIDPEFDSPEVLEQYGRNFSDDPSTWTFATGSPGRIDEMTTRFSVFMENNPENNTIDHALATALIDPAGNLVNIWRGNAWEPDDVIAMMREVVGKDSEL